MHNKNTLVLYKKQPALITDFDGDKILIQFQTASATPTGKKAQYGQQKVREKDIIPLSSTPCKNFEDALTFFDDTTDGLIHEAYELLLSDEAAATTAVPFAELSDIIKSGAKAEEQWFIFSRLTKSVEFALDEPALKNGEISFIPRTLEEIEAIRQKNYEKEHEDEIRAAFIGRLKQRKLELPSDAKFMAEVENVALCKTEKSRVLVEAGIAQTPEKAHKLLLDTGIWDITKNPYPTRYGLSMTSAQQGLGTPPDEERIEIPGTAYAIDNEWSADPDDAVSFDGTYLWIHIADPASSVEPDSPVDKAARNRGTTLYLPDGAVRMLAETCLEDYALGLTEKSRALSFRLLLNDDCSVQECKIFKTIVTVKRLTYKAATEQKDSPELKPLFDIAARNIERRKKSGAIQINMPEVHISVDGKTKQVSISPLVHYEADAMVCEMMLLAGEGAAHFAYNNRIPFPFVSQDAPDIPSKMPDGMAGQFQLLKCMRKRSVGITPAMHCGLGIAIYSQVTSPLRRYSDLIAHEQLRAYLAGKKCIDKDTMLERISQADAASVAARKASRFSDTHWKLIFLLQNPGWQTEAVCIDTKDTDSLLMIPSLAMQTTLKGVRLTLNQQVTVKASNIDIPTQTVDFIAQ